MPKLNLKTRVLPTVGAVVALVVGFGAGIITDKGPPPPSLSEIRTVVNGAVVPLRNDVNTLAFKVSAPKTEVIVQPVKTEAIAVTPPTKKKPKAKKPANTGIFALFKS